jgi:hypothetical protein
MATSQSGNLKPDEIRDAFNQACAFEFATIQRRKSEFLRQMRHYIFRGIKGS